MFPVGGRLGTLRRLYVSGAQGKAFMSCLLETDCLQHCPLSHCILVWDMSSFAFIHTLAIVTYSFSRANTGSMLFDLWESWVKATSPSPQLPLPGLPPQCHDHVSAFNVMEGRPREVQEQDHVTLAQTFRHRGLGGDNESTHLEVAEIRVDSHNRLPSKPHLPPVRENKTSEILKHSQGVSNHIRNRI